MSAEKGARRDADDEAENVERGLLAAEATAAASLRIAIALERLVGVPRADQPQTNVERVVGALEDMLEAYQTVVSSLFLGFCFSADSLVEPRGAQ